jgi:hypothetical protein
MRMSRISLEAAAVNVPSWPVAPLTKAIRVL